MLLVGKTSVTPSLSIISTTKAPKKEAVATPKESSKPSVSKNIRTAMF